MSDPCILRKTAGLDAHCEHETCIYWRAVGHVGVDVPANGCALQYFELLDGGSELAAWLLSVKQRVEAVDCDTAARHAQPADRQ